MPINSKVDWSNVKFKQRVFMPNGIVQCPFCGVYFIPHEMSWKGSSQKNNLGLFKEHYTCNCISCKKSFKLDEVRKIFPNKFVAQLVYRATPFDYSESHTL